MKKTILGLITIFFCFLNADPLFAAADTWTQMADFGGTTRVDAVGFSIGSKGYVGTGYDGANTADFWEYDSLGNTWTQKADFAGSARQAAVGFSIGTKGYIGTGYDGAVQKDFWEYDPGANAWTQKTDFGGPARFNAVGFSIGNKGYIGTGYDGSTYYKDFWEYDPATDTWSQKANIESFYGGRREAAVGFSIGSKGYIGLGVRIDIIWVFPFTTYLQDFYEYDPTTDAWTMKSSFAGGARYDAVGFSVGNLGYVGTGYFATSSATYYRDFWEFDPVADTWTQRADFGGSGRRASVGFSVGSQGYIGLGFDSSTFLNDFWNYDTGLDTIPDPFTFVDQTGVTLSTVITSNTITVSGIGAAAFISVTGGTYSINGGTYTSAEGSVNNGDTVTVQQTSAGNYLTTTNATLYISGVSDTFSVTTEAAPADMTPDPFTFIDQTDVTVYTVITSNTITVSGITSATPISITGGEYSINGGAYTSLDGTVANGDTVTVRQTSSRSFSVTTDATLTIGGVSDTFSVTTEVSPPGSVTCFIASAAFGSPLAGQVEILRKFRDRYLLTNYWGKKFVAWYYRNGPIAANYIKDKPVVKAAVRVALYPLICFSYLLIYGYLPVFLLGSFLTALLFLRFRPQKIK